ncbi:MAG: hypothetical protein ACR5K6_04800 [Wolbachia sp.]
MTSIVKKSSDVNEKKRREQELLALKEEAEKKLKQELLTLKKESYIDNTCYWQQWPHLHC